MAIYTCSKIWNRLDSNWVTPGLRVVLMAVIADFLAARFFSRSWLGVCRLIRATRLRQDTITDQPN
jgi:hypothetical protein